MQEQHAGRKANDAEHAVECLGQHALDFPANKTGRGQVQIGKRQHVALDATLLLFVDGHEQQHADERSGDHRDAEA